MCDVCVVCAVQCSGYRSALRPGYKGTRPLADAVVVDVEAVVDEVEVGGVVKRPFA